MLKCREFAQAADRMLDGDMRLRERLAMRLHWLHCHVCRRYLRQLRQLLRSVPFMHGPASDEEVAQVMQHLHHREKSL